MTTNLPLSALALALAIAACSSHGLSDGGTTTTDAASTTDVAAEAPHVPNAATTDVAAEAPRGSDAADVADVVSTSDARACALTSAITFGQTGGNARSQDESVLVPPAYYALRRTRFSGDMGVTTECTPALPACGAIGVISIPDVVRALADPDVVAAFARGMAVYGQDPRPVDGTIFFVRRPDLLTFYIGDDCGAGATGCLAVPRGLRFLADQLKQLADQMLATPECASFR